MQAKTPRLCIKRINLTYMKNLFLLPSLLFTATLSAQNLSTDRSLANLNESVHALTQNALLTLIGIVALAAVAWLAWIGKSCAELNRKTGRTRTTSMLFGMVALFFCAFFGSCSVEQRTRAAEYRAAQAYENRTCPMNQHHTNSSNAGSNQRTPYYGYDNSYGPVFCKRCGQMIAKR
jgi:glucan phosphoethanolaminetransferase (alkaline phosphatase superfamily)